jgi:phosphohistidine phosphatase SixA
MILKYRGHMRTVFLIRHADVDLLPTSGSDNPSLNSEGWTRAEVLAHVVGAAGVETIFTSSLIRTKQTVEPLATRLHLQPREAPSPVVLAKEIRSGTAGAVILIAGHSNTVPQMIAAFGASSVAMNHRDFDNLFVVTIAKSDQTGLVHLKYGKPST